MRRLLLPLLVILLAAARPADAVCTAADVIACGPNCWTCVGSTCTLAKLLTVTPPAAGAACTFDFGTRDIVLASGGFTAGPNAFEIRAHSLTVDGSGTLKATGNQATPGGIITLTLGSGGLRVLATANLIDLTGAEMAGNFTAGGGTFIVQSDGDVVLAGPGIAVDGTTPNAQGGNITLTAGRYAGPTLVASGNVAMAAPLSATAKVGGCGGNVMVTANGGTIDVEDRIQVAGGFGGGSVCLQSDGNTTLGTTPSGGPLLVADATGDAGSGGCIDVVASGQIVGKNGTTGRVLARGSNAFITTDGGGCGGMISLDAAGPLTLGGGSTGGIDASGGQLGFGGTICLMTDHSGSDLTLGVPLAAGAAGLGAVGGCIDVCSAGRALLQDDIDVSADCAGGVCVGALSDISLGTPARAIRADGSSGSIDLCAGGQVTLAGPVISAAASSTLTGSPGGSVCVLANGPISADGPVDTSASGPNSGGSVDIEAGKDLNVAATATLNANGGSSGGTGGSMFLAAGVPDLPGTLMLNGLAHATGSSAPNTPGPARGNLRACMIHVGPTGVLDTHGDALAENTLVARTGITVDAGALIATSGADPKSRNFVTVPIGAPSPNPAAFTPPLLPTDVQFQPICTGPNQPPNCLIPCPDCGNGQVEYPETCDRGAGNGPCQPCSATCRTINCNDNNPCTTDTCDVLAGCQNTPIAGCTTTTTTTSTSSSTSITSTTSPTVTTSTLVSTTTTSVAPTTTTVVVATTSTTVAATTSTTISTSTTQPPTTTTTASTSTSTTPSTTQQSTTTSFTTTTSTSSTTTFPPGCTVAPTFASVDCRLELLIGTVNVETDLGRLKIGLLKQLRRAKLRTERAQGFFSHKRASTAKSMLRDAVSAVGTFDQRLESNNGRRIVPPATDAMLLAGGERIHADLQRLLRSL